MTDTNARLWHPWLRINRVLRVMLRTRWSAETSSVVRLEFRRAAGAATRDPANTRRARPPPRGSARHGARRSGGVGAARLRQQPIVQIC